MPLYGWICKYAMDLPLHWYLIFSALDARAGEKLWALSAFQLGTKYIDVENNIVKLGSCSSLLKSSQFNSQRLNSDKKEQSWCYNPNAPTTTTPQLFKAAVMMIFTLFQLTIQIKDKSMIFWMTFQTIFQIFFSRF